MKASGKGFPGGSVLPASQETQGTLVRSLGWEDPLEEEMATHSSILARKIPWTENPMGQMDKIPQATVHGATKSDAAEHAHTKASGREGWALLPGVGKGSGAAPISPPVFHCNKVELWGQTPLTGRPLTDRCGFGILGREVNSWVTYSMRLSAIFFPIIFSYFSLFLWRGTTFILHV